MPEFPPNLFKMIQAIAHRVTTLESKGLWTSDNSSGDTFTATTDINGYITITHGLGYTPARVFVTPKAPSSGGTIFAMVIADTFGSTTFRVRCLDNSGSAINAVSVTGMWQAFEV